jgi:hypothetical protein
MFKDIQRGFEKFFTTQRVIVLIIFIIIAWGLLSYSTSKGSVRDLMSTGEAGIALSRPSVPAQQPPQPPSPSVGKGYALQPVANPSDLLPQDQNSQWSALNPNSANKGDILMPDLLQAGYHIGLDTIGQTLRNPNLQLRSDPLIPKSDIGPWNQSTIEADIGRVPLEIGQ